MRVNSGGHTVWPFVSSAAKRNGKTSVGMIEWSCPLPIGVG